MSTDSFPDARNLNSLWASVLVETLVRTGTGRDAKDVAFSTFFGNVSMTRMQIDVLEHEPRKTADSGREVVELAAVGST